MKNVLFFTLCLLGMAYTSKAQVGIGTTTPHASAQLQIDATNRGLLAPRLSLTQRNSISSPATGLLIYQTDNTPGFYYYDGSAWQAVSADALPAGTSGQTLRHDGTDWVANSLIYNNGTNVGINTATPNSMLDVQGSIGLGVTTVTAATTLNNTHNVVLCNTGPYTVTLPQASTCNGRVLYIKNIDAGGNHIIIDGNGADEIEGNTTYNLHTFGHAIRIVSDGTGWYVLDEIGKLNKEHCGEYFEFVWNDVTNPETGRTWMDRNLGAKRVATSSTDAEALGDLYQWGRAEDGHQCRNSGTTTTLSSTDAPGHGDFITTSAAPDDWRNPQNDNLWQGVNGTNNPCPGGYRLPTQAELTQETATWPSTHMNNSWQTTLAAPINGRRIPNGNIVGGVTFWTSTVIGTNAVAFIVGTSIWVGTQMRATGLGVRCIKD